MSEETLCSDVLSKLFSPHVADQSWAMNHKRIAIQGSTVFTVTFCERWPINNYEDVLIEKIESVSARKLI